MGPSCCEISKRPGRKTGSPDTHSPVKARVRDRDDGRLVPKTEGHGLVPSNPGSCAAGPLDGPVEVGEARGGLAQLGPQRTELGVGESGSRIRAWSTSSRPPRRSPARRRRRTGRGQEGVGRERGRATAGSPPSRRPCLPGAQEHRAHARGSAIAASSRPRPSRWAAAGGRPPARPGASRSGRVGPGGGDGGCAPTRAGFDLNLRGWGQARRRSDLGGPRPGRHRPSTNRGHGWRGAPRPAGREGPSGQPRPVRHARPELKARNPGAGQEGVGARGRSRRRRRGRARSGPTGRAPAASPAIAAVVAGPPRRRRGPGGRSRAGVGPPGSRNRGPCPAK